MLKSGSNQDLGPKLDQTRPHTEEDFWPMLSHYANFMIVAAV